jgi:hypothetical protein
MPYTFTHGAGTEADPYQVWTAADLNGVRDHLSAHFIQMADIDLSEYEDWEPIGAMESETDYFSGSYDGNGYSVSNLTTSQPMLAGLFGTLFTGGIIKNLAVIDCNVTSDLFAGGLVAQVVYSSNIQNCMTTGVVTVNTTNEDLDYTPAGGLIGFIIGEELSIENCFSTCTVSATNSSETYGVQAGGLIGVNDGATIINSYSIGEVTASAISYASKGGLVGINYGTCTSCYYDFETSGCLDDDGRGTPKTTVEMKQQATFVDWDFTDVWAIDPNKNDGYPYLQWQKFDDPFQPWTAPKMEASWWEGFKLPFNVLELDDDAPIAINRNFKEIEHFINILGRTSGEIKDSIGQFAAATGGESSEYPIEWSDEEESDVPSTDSSFAGYMLGKEGQMGSIDASIKTDEFGGINEVWIARVIDRQGIVEIYDSDAPEHIFRTVAREFGLPIVNLGAEIVDVAIEFDGTYNQYGIFVSDAAPDLFWVERTSDEDIVYSVKWNGTGTPPEPIELARAYLGDLYGRSSDLDSSITV